MSETKSASDCPQCYSARVRNVACACGIHWVDIGKRCSANRRSLWLKINPKPGHEEDNLITIANVENIELCAGREGDDSYVKIPSTNPLFAELLDLFLTAQFAADT